MLTESQAFFIARLVSNNFNHCHTFSEAQGCFKTVGESAFNSIFAHESVNHDVNGVLFITRQFGVSFQELNDVNDFPIHPGANKALTGKFIEEGVVLAFTGLDDRSQDLETGSLCKQENSVNDLLGCLTRQFRSIVRAMLHPNARIEQSQIVIDLGDGSNSGSWVFTRGLLIDRNRW